MNILKRRVGELFEHVWPNEHAPNLSKGKPLGSRMVGGRFRVQTNALTMIGWTINGRVDQEIEFEKDHPSKHYSSSTRIKLKVSKKLG
jgi:hypothetical protein